MSRIAVGVSFDKKGLWEAVQGERQEVGTRDKPSRYQFLAALVPARYGVAGKGGKGVTVAKLSLSYPTGVPL